MLKVTLWHEPEGHAFCIRDSKFTNYDALSSAFTKEGIKTGLSALPGFARVRVLSEFSEIPITVEYDDFGPEPIDPEEWDSVNGLELLIDGEEIVFESVLGDEFGNLKVKPGSYNLRICSGGQSSLAEDGSTEDFYLVQVWPAESQDL